MAIFSLLASTRETDWEDADLGEGELNEEDFDYLADKAEQGDAEAQFQLAQYLEENPEYEDDWELAAKWYEMAAKQHFPGAVVGLGRVLLLLGDDAPKLLKKGLKILHKAAERGDAAAAGELGNYYLNEGSDDDFEKGIQFLRQAIAGGVLEVRSMLADELLERGSETDWPEAVTILETLRNEGDVFATFYLVQLYEEGEKVVKNLLKAFLYCKEASSDEFPEAMYHLGEMFINGIGCKRDRSKGEALCKRAETLEKQQSVGECTFEMD